MGGLVNAAGTFSKKVISVDQAKGMAEIELKVTGKQKTQDGNKLYMVLVVDNSSSMKKNNRESKLKTALTDVTNALFNEPNKEKIHL